MTMTITYTNNGDGDSPPEVKEPDNRLQLAARSSTPLETKYVSLERGLRVHPTVPLPAKLSILLDVCSELARLHAQTPPVCIGDFSRSVMLTADLRATLVEDATGERSRAKRSGGGVSRSRRQSDEDATPRQDVYHFGLLVLTLLDGYPSDKEDGRAGGFHREATHLPLRCARYDGGKKTTSTSSLSEPPLGRCEAVRLCLANLALSCLQPDPAARPSAEELRTVLVRAGAFVAPPWEGGRTDREEEAIPLLFGDLRQLLLRESCNKRVSSSSSSSYSSSAELVGEEKFAALLEEENRQLRGRCGELETENERLRRDLLLATPRGRKGQSGTESKERGLWWLSSFIRRSRSRRSARGRKSALPTPTASVDGAALGARGNATVGKTVREGRPSQVLTRRPTTDIHGPQIAELTVAKLSQNPLFNLSSRDNFELSGEDEGKAQSYEVPVAAPRLEAQPWYRPDLTVEEAQQLLMEAKTDGAFLVRESTTTKGQYTLSVCQGGRIRHVRIQAITRSQYTIDDQIVFETIIELVKYYKNNLIKLNDGFEALLLHVCSTTV